MRHFAPSKAKEANIFVGPIAYNESHHHHYDYQYPYSQFKFSGIYILQIVQEIGSTLPILHLSSPSHFTFGVQMVGWGLAWWKRKRERKKREEQQKKEEEERQKQKDAEQVPSDYHPPSPIYDPTHKEDALPICDSKILIQLFTP